MLARTCASPVPTDDRLGERRDDPLGDGHRLVGAAHVLAEDHELVAADAGRGVAGAQDAGQPAGDRDQQQVPDLVAERVVDRLEAVEVEHEHADGLLAAPEATERLVEAVAQQHPVRQAGERIVHRLARELVAAALALDGEPERAHEARAVEAAADDHVLRTAADRAERRVLVVVVDEHDDGNVGDHRAQFGERAEHGRVVVAGEQHRVGGRVDELGRGLGGARQRAHVHEAAGAGEQVADHPAVARLRLHDEQARRGRQTGLGGEVGERGSVEVGHRSSVRRVPVGIASPAPGP